MIRTPRLVSVALAMLLVGVATPARAALISATDVRVLGFSGTVELPKFDPSLGTLNSVVLTLNATREGSGVFIDTPALSPLLPTFTVVFTITQGLELLRPDHTLLLSIAQTATTGSIMVGSVRAAVFLPLPDGSAAPLLLTDAADLALFSGPGTISLPANGSLQISGGGILGDIFASIEFEPQANRVTTQVTYDFTPAATAVPAPPTVVLLGLGLMGLFGYNRRAKARG